MAQGVEAARRFFRNCFALSVIISRELQSVAAVKTTRMTVSRVLRLMWVRRMIVWETARGI
jgi:hypothetical protein